MLSIRNLDNAIANYENKDKKTNKKIHKLFYYLLILHQK